jgi:OOP family OmpA-OmpF porin
MKLRHAMATLAATLFTTSPALAQSSARLPGFQLERMDFNPSAVGSVVMGTGEMPSAGEFRISLLAHHEHAPLTFYRSDIGHSVVIENRLTTEILASWAATDHLEFGLQLPLIVRQDSADLNHLGLASPSSSGLSTPQVHARQGLLAERDGRPMDLSVELSTGLPLGSTEALAGDKGFRLTPKVMAGHSFSWLRVGAEAGLLLQPTVVLSPRSSVVLDEIGDELRFGATVSTTNAGLRGEVAVRGALPLVRSPASLELIAGARYPMASGWEVFALGGMGFGSSPGTPQFRAVAGISFGGGTARPPRIADCTQEGTCPAAVNPPPPPVAQLPSDAHLVDDPDQDQVPSAVDNCPQVPGPVENHGCPGERQRVVITQRQLVILDKIYFEFNRARIQRQSFSLLDQVAHVLQEHPEITLVSIDGHTDNVGSARYNEALSQARADAVRRYLVQQGVGGSRLASRGFGFSQPAFSNDSPEGRDSNRRVEFNIVSTEHGQDGSPSMQLTHR